MDHASSVSLINAIFSGPLAYIRVEYQDGKRTCVLVDEDGDDVALSIYGMSPLISYAADHGFHLVTRH